MAGSAKHPAPSKSEAETLSYEEALKRLETIVEAMEAGDLPLEKMLSQYEQGMHLGQVCQAQLVEAELKIQQLEKSAGGELVLKPVSLGGLEDE